MYNVTATFSQKAYENSRTIYVKATIGSTNLTGADIISIDYDESFGDEISMGTAVANSITMSFLMPQTPITLSGATVTPYVSFDNTEWCPLGVFKINDFTTKDKKVYEITAYDKMAFLTDTWTSSLTYPTTCQAVINELATNNSFTVKSGTTYVSGNLISLISCTEREIISYVAGLNGCNAHFNRDGELEFEWYHGQQQVYGDMNNDGEVDQTDCDYVENNLIGSVTDEEKQSKLGQMIVGKAILGKFFSPLSILADVNTDGEVDQDDVDEIQAYVDGTPYPDTKVGTVCKWTQSITRNEQYIGELTVNKTYTVTSLVSGTSDTSYTSGSGKAITFYNPFMTQSILDGIKADKIKSGFSYLVSTVKYRCNPAFEVGDIVGVTDQDGNVIAVPIMSQKMTISGGLVATIDSYGLSDESTVISQSAELVPQGTIAERLKQVAQISDTITGATGGYYRLLQDSSDNNRPYGIQIGVDQNYTKSWKFTYGGLGFFNGNTLLHNSVAFDMNGNLNAKYITTGTLDASQITVTNLSASSITTGVLSAITIKQSKSSLYDTSSGCYMGTDGFSLGNYLFYDSTTDLVIKNLGTGSYGSGSHGQILIEDDRDNTVAISEYTLADIQQGVSAYSIANTAYSTANSANSTANSAYSLASGKADRNGSSSYYFYAASFFGTLGSSGSNQYVYLNPGSASVDTVYRSTNSGILGTSSSLRKWKNSIENLTDEVCDVHKLYELPVRQFKWNEGMFGEKYNYDEYSLGFIAEEVLEHFPRGTIFREGELASWGERNFIPAMLKLIQEQHKEIEELKSRIEVLENDK